MERTHSLVGQTFGRLKVIEAAEPTAAGNRRWLCRCECGNTCPVLETNLKRGHTQSCGCLKSPDLTGRQIGKLKVLGLSDKRGSRGKRTTLLWKCQCECGAITYKPTDILNNQDLSMCSACAEKYGAQSAREHAGFVEGTQVTKIQNMTLTAANTSGYRGVYYDKRSGKWRARLRFKGRLMNFGSHDSFEKAVQARKATEREYFGTFLEEMDLV